MRRLIPLIALFIAGCRYRGLPENFFVYPIREGAVWYYEEDVPPDYPEPVPLDSIVVLSETTVTVNSNGNITTTGDTTKAWNVYKTHESSYVGLVVDTNLTFFHRSFIMEWLPTKGLFPDSIQYGSNQMIYFKYAEDSVLVKWLPLYVRPGDEWIMARSSGSIIIEQDTCSLTLDVWGRAQGYENITYEAKSDRYKGKAVRYERSLRVDYYIKGGVCNLGVEITLLKIWWKSGIGPVKNVAKTSSDSLVTYLVDYNL